MLSLFRLRNFLTLQTVGVSGSQGSLILGGYDANRIKRNDITFPFGDDVERVHSVILQNIYVTPQLEGTPHAINTVHNLGNWTDRYLYPVIESNRPYLFLPTPVCAEIARHFGAQYDKQSDHYLMSNQSYQDLQTKSTSLTFEITPPQSTKSVKITLPSSSLALRLDYPLRPTIKNSSWYLPIRHAENSQQLALGRAFLQDAVLISDYERGTFSIHQAVPSYPGIKTDLRPILINKRKTLDSWDERLSKAAIAGIVAGAVTLVLLLSLLVICLRRRRIQNAVEEKNREAEVSFSEEPSLISYATLDPNLQEANSSTIHEIAGESLQELETRLAAAELDDSSKDLTIFELEGREVSSDTVRSIGGDVRLKQQDMVPVRPNRPLVDNRMLVVPTRPTLSRQMNDAPASPIPKTPSEYYEGAPGRVSRRRALVPNASQNINMITRNPFVG
jgi:hypothetical protein